MGVGGQHHAPAASTPGKDPVPILQEVWWAPGPVWTGGKSRPHRNSIPDRPARSQSLYRLSYLAHTFLLRRVSNTRSSVDCRSWMVKWWIFSAECHNCEIIVREICNVPDGFSGNGTEELAAFWEPFVVHNIFLSQCHLMSFCGLRGPPSWAWQKRNRLLRLGRP